MKLPKATQRRFQPPELHFDSGNYTVRFAKSPEEVDAALCLRFHIFNLEMGEGLESAARSGRDKDKHDEICHHLVVLTRDRGSIVGTYRLQTFDMAQEGCGFYTNAEFELSSLPRDVLTQSIELGRACVAREHRSGRVLFLLWRGLTAYMNAVGARYFFGCSSLPSQDPRDGRLVHEFLDAGGLMHPSLLVKPRHGFECQYDLSDHDRQSVVILPTLMQLYFNYGVKACGPPAIDREFKTIDFFVLLDKLGINERQRKVLFGG